MRISIGGGELCGIAGFVGRGEIDVSPRLEAMAAAMHHRGPDDRGVAAESTAGITMQRLSIVGIETGSQPIFSEDRRFAIVGNGEIYNAPELRKELEARGHRFRGASDIESILHLFEERGTDAFSALNGMFGIAVWDRHTGRVTIARDRLGIKPLFYGDFPSGIGFASELPSLLAALSPGERRAVEVDPTRVHEVLRHGYITSPGTIYRNVHRLPAGHWVNLDAQGASEPQAWWILPEYTPESRSLDAFAEEAEALLRHSVQLRTLGDVPPGAFLSGGLDSGTVVSLLTETLGHGVPCFTIAFDDAGLDEAEDAARTAAEFGCPHHVERLDSVGIDELDELFAQFGEPFADVSLLPMHRVSKLAAGHVKYVLSGDGGDELFAGYAWLTREVQLRSLPSALRGTARLLSPLLRHGQRATGSGLLGKAMRTVGDLASSTTDSFLRRRSLGSRSLLAGFAGPALEEALTRSTTLERFAAEAPPGWETLLDLDRRYYLPGDILEKVDRATMFHSLEARVPSSNASIQFLWGKIDPISASPARRFIDRVFRY
ncbi:MAG: asparagine synthase (glutamine-hydrolyzing) [Planctomycetota bacterium]